MGTARGEATCLCPTHNKQLIRQKTFENLNKPESQPGKGLLRHNDHDTGND